jgi:site-specific DNA-methyltransferase (adenine-specific)
MLSPYYQQGNIAIYHGDCIEVLGKLISMRFSTVITDPPYGLSFMGKMWDHGVPGERFWKRFAMLCHPGAMLLSFGGTRTHHRLMCSIEDAGWEIRDMLMWVYGSGFPKSLDIGKAIDKAAGVKREVVGTSPNWRESKRDREQFGSMEVRGENAGLITVPATDTAQLWDGYGTALKPAFEPIILAMNPLDGTYANNALKHGVAGINVDGGRVGTDWTTDPSRRGWQGGDATQSRSIFGTDGGKRVSHPNSAGRWPANLIHDGSDEVLAEFPQSKSGKAGLHERDGSTNIYGGNALLGSKTMHTGTVEYGDSGSAARFFYCAKASKAERTCNGQV